MPFEVETRSLDDQAAAVGAAGPYTVIIDRPAGAGGGGLGFGGELLYLAVAGRVSNDLFREAQAAGIALRGRTIRRRPVRPSISALRPEGDAKCQP
jgi:putative redox protein